MQRRDFLKIVGAASITPAGIDAGSPPSPAATVLYDDRSIALDRVGVDPARDPGALWIRKTDLPRVNGFALKPQGACRADLCIPIPKAMTRPRSVVGRSMIGSSGMNFVSTVRTVIEVPPTQSWRYPPS
jgi:hypothetical protein